MKRLWPALLLLGAGCGKWEAEHWKQKFVQETNYHYQTQQIKNAEIAARDLEVENQKSLILILQDRIAELDRRGAPRPTAPGPAGKVEGKVAAVDLVLLSVGRQDGVAEGMEFRLSRDGETVGTAVVERVDPNGSAARLKVKKSEPKVGDAAVGPLPRGE